MVQRCLVENDFSEGVSALLVEKRSPKWSDLSPSLEQDYFGSDKALELDLVDDKSYMEYPHHCLSGLPTVQDVRSVFEGSAQRGATYDINSPEDIVQFFLNEWGAFDSTLIGSVKHGFRTAEIAIKGGNGYAKGIHSALH